MEYTKRAFSLLGLLAVSSWLLASAQQTRIVESLNFGWSFHAGEIEKPSAISHQPSAANPTDWQEVNLPHDFQISQPWVAPDASERADNSDAGANIKSRLSARAFKEMGCGWYVKTITPPMERKGMKVLLDFEGLLYYGDVYLNGERVGGTDYGYVGFEVDVTQKLKFGEENVIAVYANTATPKNSRWYTGAGLYRDVHIIYKNPALHFQRHPLRITTEENRKVNIGVEFYNGTKQKEVTAHVVITAPDGSKVYDNSHSLKVNRGTRNQELAIPTIEIANPQLWDCEHPNLYQATVELVLENGKVTDEVSSSFGIRTIEFGPEFGFKLNGKKTLLKGNANHHTLGALGAAAYPRAIEKRIQMLKSFGFNHIRSSHNPYSESFLDLCDKYGILVVDELYDKWNAQYVGGGRSDWSSNWQYSVPEWVKRDRNHPSVIMWSLGNELQSYNDQPFNDWGVTCYKLQDVLIKRYDDTRKTTVAMHPRYRNWETDSLPCDLAMATEIQSYNYRYMYFPGDRQKFPWMTFYQSEANMSNIGANWYEMELDKVVGLAYWGMIDYLGESNGWPAKGWMQGAFDVSLEPKPVAYFLKSFFNEDEPLVHIGIVDGESDKYMWNDVVMSLDRMTDHWNRIEGTTLKTLWTYTNCDEVELYVNGKSIGKKTNDRTNARTRNKIRWDGVVYHKGNIEAVARNNGKVVARHKVETTGDAKKLVALGDKSDWKADGMDLMHVRVAAVDSKNREVKTAADNVTFSIEGPAEIVGVVNGDMLSDELHVGSQRKLYNGTCTVILRAQREAGTVTITAKADGLKTARTILNTTSK